MRASTGTDPRLTAGAFVNDRLTAAIERSRAHHPSAADLADYEEWANGRDAALRLVENADGPGDSDAA